MSLFKSPSQSCGMRLVTLHMPQEALEGLDELVRQQRYPNRSEAIRFAIRDLLKSEVWPKKQTSASVSKVAE